jgi:glycosyltransferase involved in cell wall biosynthesis
LNLSQSFKTRPTILQVVPALGAGGVEIETIEIAKAILKAGGRALVVSSTPAEKLLDIQEKIEFHQLPLNAKSPLQLCKNVKLLKALIIKEGVDIVHARSRAPAWSAFKAARSLNIPFVTTYHAAYGSGSIFKKLYNSIMARGERVITISHFIENHVIQKYKQFSWFDAGKLRHVKRGVDVHYFDPDAISQERLNHLRKSWGITPGTPVILLPGRVTRKKGQDLLIKALSLMEHGGVTVMFLGSAHKKEDYLQSLLQYASSLDLEGCVKWMPPCPDVPAAYQLADVIVCPSLAEEGFGRVVAEAQAMKKPIIVSGHGAAPEVIEEGVTGWSFTPGDPVAFSQKLDEVLNLSPKELETIGEKGRARVLTHYSTEIMGSKTIDVYKELLEGES